VAAGTFADAVDAHARGDYAKALRLIRPLANVRGKAVPQDYVLAHMWFSLAAAQVWAKSGKDSRNGRAEDDPSSDERSAEARTRLRNQLLIKGVCSAACPPTCNRTTPRGQFPWKRYGTVGHIGS